MSNPRVHSRRRVLGLLAGAPALMLAPRARASSATRLTILHTNDTHSRMEPFENGKFKGRAGVARRATVFKAVRAENPNTFAFDAGDTFQGTSWFNAFKGEVDIKVMQALGYDATCIGNHDFDAGAAKLSENLKHASGLAPLAANFSIDDSSPLASQIRHHTVIERGGVKVGVFGLGIAFDGLVNPKLHKGLSYTDPREAAAAQVAALRDQGCQVIIALSHLGFSGYRGEVGDQEWPKDVAGVHYVVGGHTHTFLKEPKVVRSASGWETPIMQVGHSGLNVGRADLHVDAKGRVDVVAARPLGVGGRALTETV